MLWVEFSQLVCVLGARGQLSCGSAQVDGATVDAG